MSITAQYKAVLITQYGDLDTTESEVLLTRDGDTLWHYTKYYGAMTFKTNGTLKYARDGRKHTLYNIAKLRNPVELKLCEHCNSDIAGEDDHISSEGETLCESCYVEGYMDQCGLCEELVESEKLSSDIIIVGEDLAKSHDIKPGFYETSGTFYMTDGFSVHLFEDNIELISELDGDVKSCNALCDSCIERIRKDKND